MFLQFPLQPGGKMSTEPVSTPTSGLDSNVAGLLCYLFGWVSGLIFLLLDKRPFVRFHAAQSIGLSIGAVAIAIAFWVITAILTVITGGLGVFLSLLFPLIVLGIFLLMIVCMVKAFKNEKFKLPVIGNIVEKMVG
jgi:Predicted membrane protein